MSDHQYRETAKSSVRILRKQNVYLRGKSHRPPRHASYNNTDRSIPIPILLCQLIYSNIDPTAAPAVVSIYWFSEM